MTEAVGTHLEPWRKRIRLLFTDDAKSFSDTMRQAAITETVQKIWGIDKPAEEAEDTDARYASALSAASLFVGHQSGRILTRLEKPDAEPDLLTLLNHTYEIDGQQLQFGLATPRQAQDQIIARLLEQRGALNRQIRVMRKLIRRCPDRDRPIIEQI